MILHCSIVPGSKGAQMDYSVLGIILLATQRLNYLLPLISEVIKEVTMRHVLRDETERLLDGDTAYEVDNVIVVAFRYLLHHLYLGEEVCPLLSSSRIYGNQEQLIIMAHSVLKIIKGISSSTCPGYAFDTLTRNVRSWLCYNLFRGCIKSFGFTKLNTSIIPFSSLMATGRPIVCFSLVLSF